MKTTYQLWWSDLDGTASIDVGEYESAASAWVALPKFVEEFARESVDPCGRWSIERRENGEYVETLEHAAVITDARQRLEWSEHGFWLVLDPEEEVAVATREL